MSEHPSAGSDPEGTFERHRVPGALAVRRIGQLSDRKQRYVEHRAEGHPPTKAAILAGLSPASARVMARRWEEDPAVVEAVGAAQEEAGTRVGVHPTDVLRELMTLAFSTMDDYEVDEDGRVTLAEDAPASALRALKSVKRRVSYDEQGNETITTEIVLWDKVQSLKLLGEHLGMWLKRLRVEDDGEARAALQALRQMMVKAAGRAVEHGAEEAAVAAFEQASDEARLRENGGVEAFRALAQRLAAGG